MLPLKKIQKMKGKRFNISKSQIHCKKRILPNSPWLEII
jgi:hypothetical protein